MPLPPDPMPRLHARRPLKQWRWVGLFGPELSVCAGSAVVWPARQSWWAVWDRAGRRLRERGRFGWAGIRFEPGRMLLDDEGVRADLAFAEGGASAVEVVTPDGRTYTWTRKEIVDAHGSVWLDGRRHRVEGPLVIDDSAGYHPRHTTWRWSCGVGRGEDGAALAWNLVAGVHDSPRNSERTVWVDGVPQEVGAVGFDPSLELVTGAAGERLIVETEAIRRHDEERLIYASHYRQPFGTFSGTLPGGARLAEGHGVMEHHVARW